MRRRRKKHHGSHERWLVSYADFITLLFAFFVVMYATSQVDKKKVTQLAAAIKLAFEQMGTLPIKSDKSISLLSREVILQPVAVPTPDLAMARSEQLSELKGEMQRALAPEIAQGEVSLRTGTDGLIISLREAGFFDSGSAGLRPESENALNRMATLLGEGQYAIRIEGHTDNIPIHTAQYPSNWELSTARATEMIRLLIQKYNFDPIGLSAGGYAEFHPIASNDTEAGRVQNRRVDVVIMRKDDKDVGTADPITKTLIELQEEKKPPAAP